VIPALLNGKAITGHDSLYVSAVIDKGTNEVIIKVVNASGKEQVNNFKVNGVKKIASKGLLTILQSNDPGSENSFAHPQNVAPKKTSIAIKGNQINLTSLPYSFSVIRVKMKK
jgi:alpha-L-arabinofuranosidase